MKTYITKIENKWYAFEGDVDRDTVYSIGNDSREAKQNGAAPIPPVGRTPVSNMSQVRPRPVLPHTTRLAAMVTMAGRSKMSFNPTAPKNKGRHTASLFLYPV